nr:tyrosine-type recombinase/integrase [Senegalia massiliensis]
MEVRFHDLRHTHATMLLKQNVHPKVVQERLGHSSIGITMDTYSHVSPDMKKKQQKKIRIML